jgi:LysM repeat protein
LKLHENNRPGSAIIADQVFFFRNIHETYHELIMEAFDYLSYYIKKRRNNMNKKFYQIILITVLIFISLASAGKVEAWSGCGSTYNVQWGDTLSGIAAKCGTTMSAIWQLNPGLGNWVYAGQVLYMPGGNWSTGGIYPIHIVAPGDTLKNIAQRYGTTMYAIANLNGIYNYNLIYVGQSLKIPTGGYYDPQVPPPPVIPPAPSPSGYTYVVQPGDTLRILAYRWGVGIYDILAVNPQITNASIIYVGQIINIPVQSASTPTNPNPSYYTVKAGDTMRIIANMFGTTVYNLQLLNPQIWNVNWIYAGMVLRVN